MKALSLFYLSFFLFFFSPQFSEAKWISLFDDSASVKPNSISDHFDQTNKGNISFEISSIDLKRNKGNENLTKSRQNSNYYLLNIIKNNAYTRKIGLPQIPIITKWIDVNNDINNLSIHLSNTENVKIYDLNKKIKGKIEPVQPSVFKLPNAYEKTQFTINEKFYKSDEFYPSKDFEITKVVSIRGRKLALVNFYPIKYNPKKNILKVNTDFEAEIEVKQAVKQNRESSVIFDNFFALKVANYPQNLAKTRQFRDTLAIIVGNKFYDAPIIQELYELKKSLGYNVVLKKMSDIGSTDIDLRNFLKNLYNTSTPKLSTILIIGDVEHVPTHSGIASNNNNNGDDPWWPWGTNNFKTLESERGQATDHFYRAIDTDNYQEDIGGPDTIVGRLPLKTVDELNIIVGKIIKYQKANFNDLTWTKKSSFLATDDRWQVAEGTHNFVMENYTTKWDHHGNFPEANQVGGDKLYAITNKAKTANLLSMFDEGRTIINYSGHGANEFWAGPQFTHSDIKKMVHNDALPFVISNACITNTFARDADSFGEMWLKAPKGAIAFWGASNNSLWDEDDILERNLFKAMYEHDKKMIGFLTNYALLTVFEHYNGDGYSSYYMEIYNITGDPSIEVLTDEPNPFVINSDDSYIIGTDGIELFILDQKGNPVKNAYVTFINNKKESKSYATNESGYAFIPVEADEVTVGEKISIFVSKNNFKLTEKQISVIPNETSYLSLQSYKIVNDDNGVINPNENFSIEVTYKNVGSSHTGLVTLTLTSKHPQITIIDDTLTIPNLEPGEIVKVNKTFNLKSNGVFLNGESLTFAIDWINNFDHISGKNQFDIKVKSPKVTLLSEKHSQELLGNGNGIIEPGETGIIAIKVKNIGEYKLTSGCFKVESLKEEILTNSEYQELEPLEIGDETVLPIEIKVDNSLKNGTIVYFKVTIVHQGGSDEFTFNEIIGEKISENVVTKTTLPLPIQDSNSNDEIATIAEVDFDKDLKLENLKVKVKLAHTFIGDLIISLIAPSGKKIDLHSRTGAGKDDIDCIYGETCEPAEPFDSLYSENPKGTWKVRVYDGAYGDTGSLKEVAITFTGYYL